MIARRVNEIPFSGIRKFFDLVMGSKDVISLGVGEPDFPTPEPLKDAAIRAIENDYTSYTSNYGIPELREEISEKLKVRNKINRNPKDEILITSGVSQGLDLAVRAITDPGDEILIPEPCYVSYNSNVWFAHGKPISVPTYEENAFRVKAEDIKKRLTKKTKGILISTPNNPTGSVLKKKDLEEIADIAIENKLAVISDEIYEDLIYDNEKHHSIASLNGMEDATITLNGYSKPYAFTGWRLGYAAGNPEFIEAMMKIHQYAQICAPSISQYAALGAFELEEYVKDMVRSYDLRRRLLVKGLNSLPNISCITPKGAFYAFPNIKDTNLSSAEFAERLLKEAGVAVIPGDAFGESGEGYIRCAYCVSREDITEALDKINRFAERLP